MSRQDILLLENAEDSPALQCSKINKQKTE
jgi:hypothetical protein